MQQPFQPARIIVVGAGIVGLACALYLQRDGHRVLLLDRQGPGEGASFGHASVLAAESVAPVALPGTLLRVPAMLLDPLGPLAIRWRFLPRLSPWLLRFVSASRPERVEAIAAALAALLSGSIEAYLPLLDRAEARAMLVRRGWIGAYADPQALRRAGSLIALQRRHGVEVEELGPEALREREPALAGDLAGGHFYPGVAHVVQSYRLVTVLAEDFQRHGGEILRGEARDFTLQDGRVVAVISDAGELACDGAVVAAGAWSRPLAARLGAPVPLETERGYHLTLPQPGVSLTRPVYAYDFGIACTPLEDGLRLAGTVELASLEAPPDWRRAEVLARRAQRLFPGLRAENASRWMGFRPSMPDSLPVLGPAPWARNAMLAFGHGHLGLTLAARSGALIADLLAGRKTPIDLSPFRPQRF